MNSNKLSNKENRGSALGIWAAYLYLTIPFLIFIFGWFKLPLAIVSAIIVTLGLIFALRSAPKIDISMFNKSNILKIGGVVIIALVWVYMSGIGGYSFQNYDYKWRNAILKTLVENDWPVKIENTAPYFDGPVTLVYYFAFWLPSACVGKIWSLEAAETFLYFWSVIGVLIVFYLISALRKKLSIPVILAFVFFSGLDIVGTFLYTNNSGFLWFSTAHIENWAYGFQISSLTTQLFWVFNQALPAWIITLVILNSNDNKNLVFIYSFSLIFCTLPAVGLIPFVVYFGIRRLIKMYNRKKSVKNNIFEMLKDTFTFQNLFAGGLIGISSFLFLRSNSTANLGGGFNDMKKLLIPYLMLIFFEFLVYFMAIYKNQHKKGLYWLSLITLLLVPLYKIGPNVDFVMRASIPSLIVLFMLIMDSIADYLSNNKKIAAAVVCVLLLLGSVTATHEMMRSVKNTTDFASGRSTTVRAEEIDLLSDYMRNNFFGKYEDSFFFKYIAK